MGIDGCFLHQYIRPNPCFWDEHKPFLLILVFTKIIYKCAQTLVYCCSNLVMEMSRAGKFHKAYILPMNKPINRLAMLICHRATWRNSLHSTLGGLKEVLLQIVVQRLNCIIACYSIKCLIG